MFAQVRDGRVVELWDVEELPPLAEDIAALYFPAPDGVSVGWTFDGEAFAEPVFVDERTWQRKRQDAIVEEWSIYQQLEALTEATMGRPEKLSELTAHIQALKAEFPLVALAEVEDVGR